MKPYGIHRLIARFLHLIHENAPQNQWLTPRCSRRADNLLNLIKTHPDNR